MNPVHAPPVQPGDREAPPLEANLVPEPRQFAQPRHQKPTDRLVRPGRKREPGPLGEVREVQQTVDLGRRGSRAGNGIRDRVVLVMDLPDQFLDQILKRDDAGRAAILVHHHGEVVALASHLRQCGQCPFAARQSLHVAGELPDRDALVRLRANGQVANMNETHYIVLITINHREARMPGVSDKSQRRVNGQTVLEEHDLGTRHHQLPNVSGASGEYLVDKATLLTVQNRVGGHQIAQFSLADPLPASRARGTEHPNDHAAYPVEAPQNQPRHTATNPSRFLRDAGTRPGHTRDSRVPRDGTRVPATLGTTSEVPVKFLVTGGAGYIGSVVSSLLLEAGHDVVVLDDLSTGHTVAVPRGALLVRGRVHDDVADVLTPDFDGVLHFAAFIEAGESVHRPEKYWENNTIGSLRLLDAMRTAGVRRLVFSSTAAVYGDPDAVPIPETAVTRPPNPYAASKLAVDHALAGEALAHGLAAVSLRYFNVAGAHVTADGTAIGERHDPESHLIPIALQVAAGVREKLALYGDDYPTPDGTCVRDYIHVSDLAAAHLLAILTMEAGTHRVFNLGNGAGFSNRQVIDVVRAVTGHPVPVEVAPRRPGDPAELVASSERARTQLGWVPAKPDLTEIVADAWSFYRATH